MERRSASRPNWSTYASLLDSLAAEPAVDSVLGVARRAPELEVPKVEWAQADITGDDLADLQAVAGGLLREIGIVLAAGEALLLGGGDDLAIAEQAGASVVVEAGENEDVHGGC